MLSRSVRGVFFASSLIAFGISVVVHLASKMQVAMPAGVMVLHAVAIGLFGSGVVGRVVVSGRGRGNILEDVPASLRGMMGVVVLYAVLNFMWTLGGMGNGQPHMEDGRYYLSGRDVPRREISEQEYRELSARIQSAFSGYWLVFLAGASLLWYPARGADAEV